MLELSIGFLQLVYLQDMRKGIQRYATTKAGIKLQLSCS